MAWGIFKKIKQGLKKAWNFAKDKIIKPVVNVATKVSPFIGGALNTIVPGAGTIATGVIGGLDKLVNKSDAGGGVNDIAAALKSGKIRLK
jgi:hypothetical protein